CVPAMPKYKRCERKSTSTRKVNLARNASYDNPAGLQIFYRGFPGEFANPTQPGAPSSLFAHHATCARLCVCGPVRV
ncbi:MAG: hypothetical protein ACREIT_06640, partial [Tepidisphaeraceae bacterium]